MVPAAGIDGMASGQKDGGKNILSSTNAKRANPELDR
jgi:hypothetical protein